MPVFNFDFFITTPSLFFGTIFIVGTFFGSFLNVILYRHGRKKESWFKGRSHCEYCSKPIAWYDNIPLLSYLLLGGKCRHCHHRISFIHPAHEFLTGSLFVFSGWLITESVFFDWGSQTSPLWAFIYLALVNSFLWLVLLFDLKYMLIPDPLVAVLSILAIVKLLFFFSWSAVIVALVIFLFFLALYFGTKKKGFGLGDVKLILPLTLILGYPNSIIGVFLAFIIGGIWGIILLVTGKKKIGQVLPFGPFLVVGVWMAMVYGEQLWQAYWQLL